MELPNVLPSNPTANRMDNKVNLQVGERVFITTKDTLVSESSYFTALFSGRWQDQDIAGTYFIDSDPVIFADVLRYMRSGNFPLYFNASTSTYEYGKYASLLGEAQYFGIARLEDWIVNKGYKDAVHIRSTIDVIDCPRLDGTALCLGSHSQVTADHRLDLSYLPRIKKVFVCPQRFEDHRGEPNKCRRECGNPRNGAEREFEDVVLHSVVVVNTHYTFNHNACLGVMQPGREAGI
ncbi:hypothetical protein GGR57DRAFT_515693 [Xylariaceae sp. FL1272]|nr:hypothetical protein GGR57DRAFT_515693 [Xylariaceae sp. FL1272]